MNEQKTLLDFDEQPCVVYETYIKDPQGHTVIKAPAKFDSFRAFRMQCLPDWLGRNYDYERDYPTYYRDMYRDDNGAYCISDNNSSSDYYLMLTPGNPLRVDYKHGFTMF